EGKPRALIAPRLFGMHDPAQFTLGRPARGLPIEPAPLVLGRKALDVEFELLVELAVATTSTCNGKQPGHPLAQGRTQLVARRMRLRIAEARRHCSASARGRRRPAGPRL